MKATNRIIINELNSIKSNKSNWYVTTNWIYL